MFCSCCSIDALLSVFTVLVFSEINFNAVQVKWMEITLKNADLFDTENLHSCFMSMFQGIVLLKGEVFWGIELDPSI